MNTSDQQPQSRHYWNRNGRTASSQATTTWKWRQIRKRALQRDNHRCAIPDCDNDAHAVDKIIPAHLGGDPYDLNNLQSLCRPHHHAKTAREASAAAARKRAQPPRQPPRRRSQQHPADLLGDGQPLPAPPLIDPWGHPPAEGPLPRPT